MADSKEMAYNRELWRFVKNYCETFTITSFAGLSGIPINTLGRNLEVDDAEDRDGFFARPTFIRVVSWIESFAADLHAQGHPLELNGVELPLRPEFRQSLGLYPEAPEDDQTTPAATGMQIDAPSRGAREELVDKSGNVEDGPDAETADGDTVVIPGGVSITRPELRGRAVELWDRAALFGNALTSADLERTFGVSLITATDTQAPYAGWLGPSLPEGETLSADMHDEIVNLIRNWQRHAYAYEICEEIDYFREHFAFRYIRRRKLEIEIILIGESRMTHPDAGIPSDEFQRLRELEWRIERIAELQDVERPDFLEILVFGTIKGAKAVSVTASKAAIWIFRRLPRWTPR